MKIIQKSEIERLINPMALVDAVEAAFFAFSKGDVRTPPVGYLPFTNPPGDMHIKYGHIRGDDVFVVKLATGFYDNPKLGLPSSNGLLLILSAKTGTPLALLQDEGFLTDHRTAAAGALASRLLSREGASGVGVIGTGIQARLQLRYHREILPLDAFYVWGRSPEKANQLVEDMAVHNITVVPVSSIEDLCEKSDIIVTTTPSKTPVVNEQWIRPGTHITAVGADAPGKQELDKSLFETAAFVCFDSREQCLHHGESSNAQIALDRSNSAEIGELIEMPSRHIRQPGDITIADLTGIAAQDIAAAKMVWAEVNTNG